MKNTSDHTSTPTSMSYSTGSGFSLDSASKTPPESLVNTSVSTHDPSVTIPQHTTTSKPSAASTNREQRDIQASGFSIARAVSASATKSVAFNTSTTTQGLVTKVTIDIPKLRDSGNKMEHAIGNIFEDATFNLNPRLRFKMTVILRLDCTPTKGKLDLCIKVLCTTNQRDQELQSVLCAWQVALQIAQEDP